MSWAARLPARFDLSRVRNQSILLALAAGLVAGLLTVINAVAYAGLIFSGPLAPGLVVGISAVLGGAAVSAVVTALASSHAGMVATPVGSAAVGYVLIASALAEPLATLPDPVLKARVLVIVCGAATMVSGLIFLLLGSFRLGFLARFLPYPVVSGYTAGLGWFFIAGGIALAAGGDPASWFGLAHAAASLEAACCVALALLMVWLNRTFKRWYVIPALLLFAGLAFHFARAASGIDLHQAARAGWLLGPFPPGPMLTFPDSGTFAAIPFAALPAVILPMLTIVVVSGSTLIMAMPGFEIGLRRNLDFDREMTVGGAAVIVSGLAGGIVTAQSLGGTMLADRIGGNSRVIGILVAGSCLAALLAGTELLSSTPRFVAGAILCANGMDRLVDRVWLDRRRLTPHEFAIVLVVVLGVVWLGYVWGVAAGLALTLMIFVWNYRRIPIVRLQATAATFRSSVVRSKEAEEVLARIGPGIQIWRLQGFLFFLNATELLGLVRRMLDDPAPLRFLVIEFRSVVGMDSSACLIFRRLQQIAAEAGFSLMLTDLPASVREQFRRHRIASAVPGGVASYDTLDAALRAAEDTLLAETGIAVLAERQSFAALISATLDRPVAEVRLAAFLERLEVPAGEVLIRQGDLADAMYFIEQGSAVILLERAAGPPIRVRTATSGVMVGEVGIYTGRRRTATVAAEGTCSVVRLSVEAIERMEREDPEMANLLHRFQATLLADKLAESNRIWEQMME
ncbi:MAG: SLC26A/SulP transporter family protein [Acetobacteraceae bacterium]|nr:SLC26A/SulP transporter family protein [Acetobacteraceae bacterium]